MVETFHEKRKSRIPTTLNTFFTKQLTAALHASEDEHPDVVNIQVIRDRKSHDGIKSNEAFVSAKISITCENPI